MLQGVLPDDTTVTLDPACRHLGGSWQGAYLPDGRRCPHGVRLVAWLYGAASAQERPVLIDGGASTGSYSLLAAALPALRVYAFEPNPDAYRVLCRNVALNSLEDRVHVSRAALWSAPGKGALNIPCQAWRAGLARLAPASPGGDCRTEPVALTTLDLLAATLPADARVTLLKLDLEGAELMALQGAQRLLEGHHPVCLIEADARHTGQYGYALDDTIAFLRTLGATTCFIDGANVGAWWGEDCAGPNLSAQEF